MICTVLRRIVSISFFSSCTGGAPCRGFGSLIIPFSKGETIAKFWIGVFGTREVKWLHFATLPQYLYPARRGRLSPICGSGFWEHMGGRVRSPMLREHFYASCLDFIADLYVYETTAAIQSRWCPSGLKSWDLHDHVTIMEASIVQYVLIWLEGQADM